MKNALLFVLLAALSIGLQAKDKKEKKAPVDLAAHYSVCVESSSGIGCSAKKFTLRDAEDVLNIILGSPIDAEFSVAVYDWNTDKYVPADQLKDVHQGESSAPKATPKATPQSAPHVQEYPGEEKI